MSYNIAVAGKGGTGKTSIASLIIRYLKKNNTGSILAVDADPNANLGGGLGLDLKRTVGSIITDFHGEKINIPAGMTKEAYLDYKLNEVIVESGGLDLLTMGRGEGPDCYCYPNLILRKFVDSLSGNYAYMIMDNEAGLEHLSRRTTQNIDALLLISDHSVKGVRTLARIRDLVTELKLVVKRQAVVINMVPGELALGVSQELAQLDIEPAALIPEDEQIYRADLEMKSLLELNDNSGAVKAVDLLITDLIKGN